MTGLTFDAAGLGMVIVAEKDRGGILELEGDVTLACRIIRGQDGQRKKSKQEQGDRSTHDHVLFEYQGK